jgi:hypothetical protein
VDRNEAGDRGFVAGFAELGEQAAHVALGTFHGG